MNRCARVPVVVFTLLALLGAVTAQVPMDIEQTTGRVRLLLDRGAYADAEPEARRLVASITAERGADSLEWARASDLLVEALLRNGHGSAAATLTLAEQVVRAKEQRAGGVDLDTASSLHNLAAVHVERGELRIALPQHRRALEIRSQLLPSNAPAIADSLEHLATTLIAEGRYEEAQPILARALGIREKRADAEPLALARTLELVAWRHRHLGEYTAGQAALARVLAIRSGLASDHPDMISATELWGDLLWLEGLEGYVGNSVATWTKGLAAAERTLDPGHPTILSFQRRLVLAQDTLGNRTEARKLLERALQGAERSLPPCHAELLALQNYRASSLTYDGEYTEARRVGQQSLAALERCLGPRHQRTATSMHNLALLLTIMGDFDEAGRLHLRAIQIWSTALGPNHPYVARGWDALAEVAAARGQVVRARFLYERALALRRRSLGPKHPDVAWTLTNLARMSLASGDLAGAGRTVAQAIAIFREVGPSSDLPDHLGRALALRGEIEGRRGDYAAARASFDEALMMRERIFRASHPLAAEARAERAAADFALGKYDVALRDSLEAEKTGRDHLQFTARYLPERQAMAYAGRRPRGLDLALSVTASASTRAAPAPSLSEAAPSVFDALIQSRSIMLDELAARTLAEDSSDPQEAPLIAEAVRARERFANLVVNSLEEKDASSPARLDEARRQLDEARRQKEEAESALAERSAHARAELTRAKIGLAAVRDALPAQAALVSFVKYDRTLTAAEGPTLAATDAQGHAARGQGHPAWGSPVSSYAAFIQRSADSHVDFVPLGPAASLEALIKAWHDEAAGQSLILASRSRAERIYTNVATRLRRAMWDPLAPALAGATRVFIVPDGLLNIVNIAALPDVGGRYLVEHEPVLHYISTERDLVPPAPGPERHGLLVVGGAAFDQATPSQPPNDVNAITDSKRHGPTTPAVAQRSRSQPGARVTVARRSESQPPPKLTATRRSGCEDFSRLHFTDLPGSRREVAEIARVWHTNAVNGVTSLSGADATETAVKQALPGQRVAHLATHGFFLGADCASGPRSPASRGVGGLGPVRAVGGLAPTSTRSAPMLTENPLLLAGLALAGANRRGAAAASGAASAAAAAASSAAQDDGILTAEEIAGLDLRGTEWAVLSACDTGLGEIKAGEGVFGLRRAFQIAGARTVIMSLWSVEDEASRVWMRALYEGRFASHLTTADAVREASLTVLRARRAKRLSTHPFYWAGFVAAGDWR